MATWIAHYDNAGALLLPPTSVAPGAAPDVAAQAMGWADGSWRVITDAEAEELMQPPPPTPEEQQAAFTAAIQQRLDAFAQTRGYDSILSAASYAASANPTFQAEGRYAVEARDAAWAKGYAILNAVLAGTRPMPAPEDVMAELPVLEWPEREEATGEENRKREE